MLVHQTKEDMLSLSGRVALVTGAGRGIGRAFAHALGDAGARVAVSSLHEERANAVTDELVAKGIEAVAIAADVRRLEDIERSVAATVQAFGGLDIAVNNAGVHRNSASEETSPEEWDEVLTVNLRSVFLCCQAEARVMLRAGYGKIINTASTAAALVPYKSHQASYNASKAGVVQLTRTLAAEWADRGVRVNAISPGIIRTALVEESEILRPLVKNWLERIPMGRLGEVEDLSGGLVYLASAASDYMTGHNLVIDGGQTLLLP